MSEELLPCPFCPEGKALAHENRSYANHGRAQCQSCGASTGLWPMPRVAWAWNRRAPSPAVATLEAEREYLKARLEEAQVELREIKHVVWHLLDETEDRGGRELVVPREEWERLGELVPEDHPAARALERGEEGK